MVAGRWEWFLFNGAPLASSTSVMLEQFKMRVASLDFAARFSITLVVSRDFESRLALDGVLLSCFSAIL